MFIQKFESGPLETNAILIGCEKTKGAIIIDPAYGSKEKMINKAKKLGFKIEKIYLTHSHWDHIADLASLKKALNCPVCVHREDQKNVENPGSDGLPLFFGIAGVKVDEFLEEGQSHTIGELRFIVLHTPGHSPGSVCFYFEEENLLISGDTLFKGSFGNVSFPGCDSEKMFASLKKLAKLPKNTIVVPGHGSNTTIGDEPWLDSAKKYFGY